MIWIKCYDIFLVHIICLFFTIWVFWLFGLIEPKGGEVYCIVPQYIKGEVYSTAYIYLVIYSTLLWWWWYNLTVFLAIVFTFFKFISRKVSTLKPFHMHSMVIRVWHHQSQKKGRLLEIGGATWRLGFEFLKSFVFLHAQLIEWHLYWLLPLNLSMCTSSIII